MLRLLLSAALIGAPMAATATDIYVCDVNGVKTFVDSPSACPQAQAERANGRGDKAQVSLPPPADFRRVPRARVGGAPRAEVVPTQQGAMTEPLCDERKYTTPESLRACVQQERRAQVRRLANARLAAIARALTVFVSNPNPAEPAAVVVFDKGRPAAWCEELLSDVMAQRHVEVVDDEGQPGPSWVDATDADGRKLRNAVDILDPQFEEWVTAKGQPVVRGYVTVRWRASHLLVLRTSPGCSPPENNGVAHCVPGLYTGFYVHETEFPVACDVTLLSHRYRSNWPRAIQIRPKVPAGPLR